jgi:Leucine-rich repeat (LRR) protein
VAAAGGATYSTELPHLPNLRVLQLSGNGLTSLTGLGLSRCPDLQVLVVSGNEVTRFDGLEGLTRLKELVLSSNKIRCVWEGGVWRVRVGWRDV